MKRLIIYLMVFISIILITGCDLGKSPTSLIQIPQLSKNKQFLTKAIKKAMPAGAVLVTPIKSSTKETIHMVDIDGDHVDEAIVFYRNEEFDREIYVLIFKKKNNSWVKTIHEQVGGYQLHTLYFADINQDGRKDIALGTDSTYPGTEILPENMTRELHIYTMKGHTLNSFFTKQYTDVVVDDFNNDKVPDISLVTFNRSKNANVQLLQWRHKKIETISKLKLREYVNGIENVFIGQLSDHRKALFLDSGIGAHSGWTDIIKLSNQQLERIKIDERQLLKAYYLDSRDVNDDEITEVGNMYQPQGWEDAPYSDTPWIETYTQYDSKGKGTKVEERYVDVTHGFYVVIPKKWWMNVTVERGKNSLKIIDLPKKNIVFDIQWYPNHESPTSTNSRVITKSGKYTFVTQSQAKMSEYQVYFHLLGEDFE